MNSDGQKLEGDGVRFSIGAIYHWLYLLEYIRSKSLITLAFYRHVLHSKNGACELVIQLGSEFLNAIKEWLIPEPLP